MATAATRPCTNVEQSSTHVRTDGALGMARNLFLHGCVRIARKNVANGHPAGSPYNGSMGLPIASTILTALVALYMDMAGFTISGGTPALSTACSSRFKSTVS